MAQGFEIAEGYLDIRADPSQALRNVQDFLRQVDRRLDAAADDAERSGRETGRRFGEGLRDGFGNGIIDLLIPGARGGEGGGGGGGAGGGFIEGITDSLISGFNRVVQEIRELIGEIQEMLSDLGGDDFLSDLREGIQELISGIRSRFFGMINYLRDTWTRMFGHLTNAAVRDFFADLFRQSRLLWSRFTSWASGAFNALSTRFGLWFSNLTTQLRGWWTSFRAWASITFTVMGILGRYFWNQFRSWGRSTFASITSWAIILFRLMGTIGRAWWSSMRGWARGLFSGLGTRFRSIWTSLLSGARSALTAIGGWLSSMFTAISSGISRAFSGLQSALSGITSALGPLGAAIGPILGLLALASLIPLILGLGGALLQLSAALFALPAAIGILVAAIAPLIVGFKGFGEAVGAGLSGDVEKFNEALKKLSPNARKVAKEFVALGPVFRSIKKSVQDGLFGPLIGHIKPLATTLFPALRTGMTLVAGALGRMLAGFADLLAANDIVEAIGDVFETTGRIIDRIGPSLVNLFGVMFGVTEKGLPFVERFFGALADGIDNLAAWLSEIQQNGQLIAWLEQAWSVGKDLWALLVAVGKLIGALFADSGDEGQTFIQNLTKMVDGLTAFFKSAEGKEFLDNLVSTLERTGTTMMWLVDIISAVAVGLNWVIRTIRDTPRFFRDLWKSITDGADAVGAWIANIARISWDWIKDATKAVGDFFVGIGRWFVDGYNTVLNWGTKIGDWFAALPGKIGAFFEALPGNAANLLQRMSDAFFYSLGYIAGLIVGFLISMAQWFRQGWDWVYQRTTEGLQKTWENIQAFPGRAGEALASFGTDMAAIAMNAWNMAYERTVEGTQKTWENIRVLPGRAGEALSGLAGRVGSFFTDTWNRAQSATQRGVDNVIAYARTLPGKAQNALSGAGNWLVDAGRNMMRGLINGISDLLGWAVGQARRAAQKVKEGFLDALGISSPSRVMRVEVGRMLLPGLVEGVDDTIPKAQRHMGAVANMMVQGFQPTVNVAAPNVSVGGSVLHADFGEGIRQVVPLVITRNPRVIAGAAAVGNRERQGWVNTGRGTS